MKILKPLGLALGGRGPAAGFAGGRDQPAAEFDKAHRDDAERNTRP